MASLNLLISPPENCTEKNGKLAQEIVTKMRHHSGKLFQNCAYVLQCKFDQK